MAYIGRNPAIGTQKVLDSLESQFNGSLTTFDLRYKTNTIYPPIASALIVSLGGVLQEPGVAYTVASDTITFASAPPTGSDCWILLYTEFGGIAGATANLTVSNNLTIGNELHGPANFVIDPATIGDNTGTVEIKGNLTVQGTQTTVNSTTVDLDHLSLGDDEIANFGTDNDIQIVHESTGNKSVIKRTTTGDLYIQGASGSLIHIEALPGESSIKAAANGTVELYYDDSKKLETKSDGIDVTGEVQCDSLDVDGIANIQSVLTMQSYIQGTTTLDLYGDSSASQGLSLDASGNVTLQANLDLQDNDKILLGSGDDLEIYHDSTNSHISNSTGSLYINQYLDDGDIALRTDDGSGGFTNYVVCDGSAGSVNLYHYGNQKFTTTSTGVNITGTLKVNNIASLDSTTLSLGLEGGANGFINTQESLYINIDSNNDETGKRFEIRHGATDASGTQLFTVLDSGNVGIGTDSPTANFKLDVNGDLTLGESGGSDNTYIDQKQNGSLDIINSGRQSSTGGIRINKTNSIGGDTTYFRDFEVYNGKNSLVLLVDGSAGNVGIGTDNPEYKTTIAGGSGNAKLNLKRLNAASDGNAFGSIFFTNMSGTDVASVRAHRESAADDAYLGFATRNTGGSISEKFRIASDGKVSISSDGTTDGLLTIKGNSDATTTPSIRLLDGTDTREVSITNTAGDFVVSTHGTDNNPHGQIKIFESGIISMLNGGASASFTERLRIDTGGDLLQAWRQGAFIGQKYQFNSTDYYGGLEIDMGSSRTLGIVARSNDTRADIFFKTGLSTAATEKMRIMHNGNVGIGTNNPAVKLDVDGSLQLRASGNYTTYATRIYSRLDSTHCSVIESYLNNTTAFEMMGSYADSGGANPRIVLGSGGQKVGINTTNPGYNLEVNGSFAATTKSFIIDHPTKPGMKLRHGSLEGPENGVYVRGRSHSEVINLPDYWTGLIDPDSITVTLTPIGPSGAPRVERIENNKVYVFSEDSRSLDYFYMINAERVDVAPLEVEIPE